MFLVIDLIIILIIALSIFLGYKRGLMLSLIKFFTLIIAVVVAFVLYQPISKIIIDKTNYDETIETSIINIFEKESKNESEQENSETFVVEYINNEIEQSTDQVKDVVVKNAANKLSILTIKVLTVIALIIFVRILLVFVKGIVKMIAKIPVIKQADKFGGIVFGVLKGLIIVFVVLAIILCFSTFIEENMIIEAIDNTYLCKILYNNNLLIKLIF